MKCSHGKSIADSKLNELKDYAADHKTPNSIPKCFVCAYNLGVRNGRNRMKKKIIKAAAKIKPNKK